MAAAYHAVRLSKVVGVTNLTLEGDAQNVVATVNANEHSTSRYDNLVGDIKTALGEFPN